METLLCRLLGHRRNARRARLTYRGWRCHCRRCGEQLIRIGPKYWLPLAEAELAIAPLQLEPLPLFDWQARQL